LNKSAEKFNDAVEKAIDRIRELTWGRVERWGYKILLGVYEDRAQWWPQRKKPGWEW